MHLEHVKQAFEILRHHTFFLKLKKCAFGQQELEYLGHIVTAHGVKVDQTKIQAMLDWPRPTNISELCGFLGLTGYYRKFVRNYGILARPLTNLLKKGQFGWTAEAETSFKLLQQAMTTTPTLAMPNFQQPFTIESDASGDGIGAVLTQQGKPLAFMSRALGVSKLSWSTYAKEMLILYKPGRENSAADALSRVPGSPTLNALFVSQAQIWEDIKTAAADDAYMSRISKLAATKPGIPYTTRHGLIFYKN
ncbi:hypothetical protein UlMin_014027 [Ulmus minor]